MIFMTYFKTLFALLLTLSVLPSSLVAQTLERIRETESITIAYRLRSTPFSYVPTEVRATDTAAISALVPVGYTIDLCKRLAEGVKRQLKLKNLQVKYVEATSDAARMEAMKTRKADMECSNTTNRADRRAIANFTIPHFIGGARAVTRDGKDIRYIDELHGKRVAAADGAIVKMLENQNTRASGGITIVPFRGNAEAIQLLSEGKVDAWMGDDVPLYAARAAHPTPKQFTISSRVMTIEPLGIMLPKGDKEFTDLINAELRIMMTSGDVMKIYNRWFNAPIPPRNHKLDFPASVLLRAYLTVPSTDLGISY
jgi:ABC-type amino acid transport substrate-binding protein